MSPESMALAEALAAAEPLAASLALSLAEMAALGPLDAERLGRLTRGEEKDVLAFLKTFEQMQDLVSRRLLRVALAHLGDDVSAYTARAAFDRAEALGAIPDAARFMDVQMVRNRIAHDYPMSAARRAERLRAAGAAALALTDDFPTLAAFVRGQIGGTP